MSHALFGDDLQALIDSKCTSESRLSKSHLMDEKDPATQKLVFPITNGSCYAYSDKDGRSRLLEDVDWTFRFATWFTLGWRAAIAIGLKCGFEYWYAHDLKARGIWTTGRTLRDAFGAHPAGQEQVDAFVQSDHYRDVVVPGLEAGLLEHLAHATASHDALDVRVLPNVLRAALADQWPLRAIFNGTLCNHLTEPVNGTKGPEPHQTEWKSVIAKERALPLLDAIMRAVLGCEHEPFGWSETAAISESLQFWKGGDHDGMTVEPIPSAGRHLSKNDCVLTQHSAVTVSDGPDGPCISTIIRSGESDDGKPRISVGDSFLVSTACDPDETDLEGRLRAALRKKLFRDPDTAAAAKLEPWGILLNVMSSKAVPDLSHTPTRNQFKDDGARPYRERPVYLLFIWKCRVSGQPKCKQSSNGDPLHHHDAISPIWHPLGTLPLTCMDQYGERALLHALRHPKKARFVGNGSAWFIDFEHPDNAAWKSAFKRT